MKYYIGLDASGSKSDGILFDAQGCVIAREYVRGANAFDIGPTETARRLCEISDKLMESLPAGEKLAGLFGSVSVISFYPDVIEKVQKHLSGIPCVLDSIVASVMAATLGKEDGVCLISGTGSYCCIKEKDKPRTYIGSSGYLLDTGGSGYFLGQQALIAAQRDLDGRGEKTILTEMIEKEVGESVVEHLPVIYAGGRPYIASFAGHIFNAYAQGDKVAKRIFDEGVQCYVESLEVAYKILKHPFKIGVGGGVFLHFSEYATAIAQRAPEGCTMVRLNMPAVYGSALEAVWNDGGEPDEQFRSNFNRTYFQFPTPQIF